MSKTTIKPLVNKAAYEQLKRLDKETLIELVWVMHCRGMMLQRTDDDHGVLRKIDADLVLIDQRRRQRPKLLASRYAEGRVAAAQGGAVQTKQRRVKLPAK